MERSETSNLPILVSQTEISFNNLTLSSNLDSGNLTKVKKLGEYEYSLYTAYDCQGTPQMAAYSSWFYFFVKDFVPGEEYLFHLKNVAKNENLMKFGYKPLFKIDHEPWERINSPIENLYDTERRIRYSFRFRFSKSMNCVYFAAGIPWSYEDNLNYLKNLSKTAKKCQGLYFHIETIIKSPESRPIHLLTISSTLGLSKTKREPMLFGTLGKSRPRTFEGKRYILLSARVHPAETAASHMLNGLLNSFLLPTRSKEVTDVLDNYVFMIVPMLNPDGVSRGYYRTDIFGKNLNRCYKEPSKEKQPGIYAMCKIAESRS